MGDKSGPVIGETLLHMAVFGAMLSYISRAAVYLMLRRTRPAMPRPFKSAVGRFGAWATNTISVATLSCQVQDPAFLTGTVWAVVWLALGTLYFQKVARHTLVLSSEERAAQAGA